ncbi:glycoside hydrolase domain-containing protein [Oceaniovalibus sp. ACAM 378]|uniref:glycoside hydrolase domain-containing protein n=1 Tax=Oceaniovalibus sp. ACAM 378 TaxID=2599923 RepID=UPI001651DA75|nr:glycoside hydrolase domain-containing protein [Oceaniovalibus sp. ACAM 378]
MRAPLLALCVISAAMPAHSAAQKSDDFCRAASGVDMVDTSQIVTPEFLDKMREIGVTTIGRYFDYEDETITGKRLRAEELPLIASYGMSLVVVFQHNNNLAETFVDWKNRGPADAREALKLAAQFGQPDNGAIYFGVDGDFVGNGAIFHTDDVLGYFEEVNRTFDAAGVSYPVGVYGSGETCFTLIGEGLAGFCWLSHSHGFTGTPEALSAGAFDIEQFLHGTCGGRPVDFNKVNEGVTAFGQWMPQ